MAIDKQIKFFHGASANLDNAIAKGTINENDLVITNDTDELIYIDETKQKKALGSSKSKKSHTVNLGGATIGSLKDGDVLPEGMTLDDLIIKLTQKAVPASYTRPGVNLRVSSGNTAGDYEVGTQINTTLLATFVQNDAGKLTNLEIKKGGVQELAGISSSLTHQVTPFTLEEGATSFVADASFAEGAVKNDNLGNPSPEGHILAGKISSNVVTFNGKRNLFFGTGLGQLPVLNSAEIRKLAGKKLAPTNGLVFEIKMEKGQQHVVFAYPANLREVTQIMYVETNDTGMKPSFKKQNISVEGANGSTSANYQVYSYQLDGPIEAPMTFKVTI